MEPWHLDDQATIYHGDCLEVLRELPDASVDSVVTDPPYGLEFMGKDWDSFKTYNGGNPNIKPQGPTVDGGGGVFGAATYGYRKKNPRCRRCGKLQRGNGACKCPSPDWDTRTSESAFQFQVWSEEWAAECLRVLKPGGHLLAFGGTRTWHRLAVAIEDAGFEIRDSIAWMYGSGFPKSLDVSKAIDKAAGAERQVVRVVPRTGKEAGTYGAMAGNNAETSPATPDAARWQGWGTALKPAHEPVVVARKPLTGTVAANVLEHGTGALNIDGCRIGIEVLTAQARGVSRIGTFENADGNVTPERTGRWPANVVLDEDQAAALDKQSGQQRDGVAVKRNLPDGGYMTGQSAYQMKSRKAADIGYGGGGGASRFFYVAKAPVRERPKVDGVAHPTVKPLTLMRWLCRLVTPPGGVVLEPFAGSGTTIEAALLEGFRVVAIEREPDYLPLIAARLERVAQEPDDGQQLTFDASA